MTRDAIQEWLLDYAWSGTPDEQAAEVACIMKQDDWKYVEARAGQFADAQEVPGPAAMDEGLGFALSEMYECHDGPHDGTCPLAK
jgi:hypothetical protein